MDYRLISAVTALGLIATQTSAQDRMPPIPPERYTDAQTRAAAEFMRERGYAVRGPFVPLIRSPEVMMRAKAMGDYLLFKSSLEPRLIEMVILIVAREWTQQYVWATHHDAAIKAGLSRDIVDAIAVGSRPSTMAADETALYNMLIEIQRTKLVSHQTWTEIVGKLGEQGVIDLLSINGYYTFLAMTMNAAQSDLPPSTVAPLKRATD